MSRSAPPTRPWTIPSVSSPSDSASTSAPVRSGSVRRRTRIADLSLNGKFFKRYYLAAPVAGGEGAYETPDRLRSFLSEKGIALSAPERAELEMLLPAGTSVLISEF